MPLLPPTAPQLQCLHHSLSSSSHTCHQCKFMPEVGAVLLRPAPCSSFFPAPIQEVGRAPCSVYLTFFCVLITLMCLSDSWQCQWNFLRSLKKIHFFFEKENLNIIKEIQGTCSNRGTELVFLDLFFFGALPSGLLGPKKFMPFFPSSPVWLRDVKILKKISFYI